MNWTVILSGLFSGYLILDFLSWIFAGSGLAEVIGSDSPLVYAVAESIPGLPQWAFWLACGLSVVIVSAIMVLCIYVAVNNNKPKRSSKGVRY